MSKHYKPRPAPPPLPRPNAAQQNAGEAPYEYDKIDIAAGSLLHTSCGPVDSLTVKFDRCDLTGQDHEIQDRSEEGYQFVESFEIDRGSIGMRFIRQKGESK